MPRIAYLTTCSPQQPTSGHALRVHANWRALRAIGTTRVWAFDTRPSPASRRLQRQESIVALAARKEARLPLLLRHARACVGDRSMLYAKAMSPRRVERLRRELDAWGTDLLVIGDTWLVDLLEPLRGSARRVAVDTHNVESHLYRRMLAEQRSLPGKLKLGLFMRNVRRLERHLQAADAVFAASPADAGLYRERHGLARLHVVPNALDTERYRRPPVAVEPASLVFTGSYGYWPNESAMHLIALSRTLDARGVAHRVRLVGRDPTEAMRAAAATAPNVTITGPVADIAPHIARAALILAPLTSGSGTKYKILEAMALERPVVTTPVGAEGLELVDGRHAVIAPDLAAFADQVARLLAEPARAECMARAGRDFVVQNHSLEALEQGLRRAIDAMERPRPTRSPPSSSGRRAQAVRGAHCPRSPT